MEVLLNLPSFGLVIYPPPGHPHASEPYTIKGEIEVRLLPG